MSNHCRQTPQNKIRACNAQRQILAYRRETTPLDEPLADTVADFLADLRHYCDRYALDFAEIDRRAAAYYEAEVKVEEGIEVAR